MVSKKVLELVKKELKQCSSCRKKKQKSTKCSKSKKKAPITAIKILKGSEYEGGNFVTKEERNRNKPIV